MKDRYVKVIDLKYYIECLKYLVMNFYNWIWFILWILYVYFVVFYKNLKIIFNLKKFDYYFLCLSMIFIMECIGWINIFILIKDCLFLE